MALSVIKFERAGEGETSFRIDLGKNRFYAYAIGKNEFAAANGVKMLQTPRLVSPLVGPLPESALGRAVLRIPNHLFDREHRALQLMTFRTAGRAGPAISDILAVPLGAGRAVSDELPVLSFARTNHMEHYHTETVPFKYRESQFSEGMFWGALASILPKVLPLAGNILSGLFKGGQNGAADAGKDGGKESLSQLFDLIRNLISGQANPATGAATGATPATSATQSWYSYSRSSFPYSQAQVAPALLAALPALMPLLEKVLTPETIQSIVGTFDPNKLMGTVTNGLKDFAKLGIELHEKDLQHLRALTPSVDDPALDQLLQGMNLSLSESDTKLDYRRVESVRLKFEDIQPVMMYGRSRVAYHHDRDWRFSLSVESPKPIMKAVLQLTVKNPKTLEVLFQQKHKVEQATGGRLAVIPTIPAARLARLVPNEDYLVCAALVWKNKSGKKIGASMSQLITVVGEYGFDRVEESGELISLNDVAKYRELWHKVWQGSFTKERRRLEFDCKYYYALEPERPANARMETSTQMDETGLHKEGGKLKSGLIMSANELNRLIPRISPHPMLAEAELAALRSPDFVSRFNQAARTKVKFSGRPGDSVALWIYPEVKMQRLILLKSDEIDDAGHVRKFAEQLVYFPMPALVHFIGTGAA